MAGMRIVAGMRWREFSQLVVDALRERGFETDPQTNTAERGQQADLLLHRDGRPWLLSCRQGENFRITPAVVAEFSKAVRLKGAAGGLITTPGKVHADARTQAKAIELVDGLALWPMLKPLLPASVRTSVAAESHARSLRYIGLAWLAALVIGAAFAWMLQTRNLEAESPHAQLGTGLRSAFPGTTTDSSPVSTTEPLTAPLTEEEQREQVRREVSDLPGIDRALWSSRSTLIVYLADDTGTDHLRSICAIVERYDDLRASRLQLQPVAGSQRAVRFLQCQVF